MDEKAWLCAESDDGDGRCCLDSRSQHTVPVSHAGYGRWARRDRSWVLTIYLGMVDESDKAVQRGRSWILAQFVSRLGLATTDGHFQ